MELNLLLQCCIRRLSLKAACQLLWGQVGTYEAGAAAMQAAGHTSYLKVTLLATRPEAQGSGLGSTVLDAAVAAADQQRLPLYLEAAHEGLLPLYARYAFKPLEKLDTMTLMVRERLQAASKPTVTEAFKLHVGPSFEHASEPAAHVLGAFKIRFLAAVYQGVVATHHALRE
jgi:GNAT superfamily N-acetyltransferase